MKIRAIAVAAALTLTAFAADVQAQQTGTLARETPFCTEDYFLDDAIEYAATGNTSRLELMMEYNMCGASHAGVPYKVIMTKMGESGLEYAQIEATTAGGPVYVWVMLHNLR